MTTDHDRPTSDQPDEEQSEVERHDESAQGGDAEAAATLEEREAVAEDRDHLFEEDTGDEDER